MLDDFHNYDGEIMKLIKCSDQMPPINVKKSKRNKRIVDIGEKIGSYTVIGFHECCRRFICRCDCGVINNVQSKTLLSDNIYKSCRICMYKRMRSVNNLINVGDVFGDWTVLEPLPRNKYKQYDWLVGCKCGSIYKRLGTALYRGISKRCRKCVRKKQKLELGW